MARPRFGDLFGSRRARSIAALICIALCALAVNMIASRWLAARIDLTAERLYTLSRGTRQTLAKLDEPITLRFYYSTRLGSAVSAYGVYAQRVREMLDQYVAASKGKLRLEVYNPQPFSDSEDRAVAFGLQGVPLNQQGEQVYFGLAGSNSTDDQQVIAFFSPERERFLEYDLTKLVHALAAPKKTVVGLMTALPLEGNMMAAMQGRPMQPTAVVEQLRQLYEVRTVSPASDSIPEGTDVLMLVHPQNLPDKTLFAIDQFVLKGGKAMVFVDPYSEMQVASMPRQAPNTPTDSNLDKLFQKWGLKLVPDTVAGDRRDARRVAAPVAGRGQQAMDYIAWLSIRPPFLNREDVITADLKQVAVASAGMLEPVEGAKTKFEPLITTSPESTKIPVDQVKGLPDIAGLLSKFRPDDKRYTIAARITGGAETAFPDGPPAPEKPPEGQTPPPVPEIVKQAAQPINVVVVADTDMLDDRFWVQSQEFFGRRVIVPSANNGDFVANAVEVLSGGEALIDLRSRGTSIRPFEVVTEIQRAAEDRYAAEQQALQEKLKETQGKLRSLTGGEGGNAAPTQLSAEQTKAVEEFRADMVKTRQQLRAVQGALRQDIERLKFLLEFVNIALIPLLVAVASVVLGALRVRRRRRRPALIAAGATAP